MARVGISIVKRVLFRGVQQEFANTYYYSEPTALTIPAEGLIDEIKAVEVGLHSTDITFVRGMAWSAGGTQAQNQMLFQKNLTGTGNQSGVAAMDAERAVLIRWPAGFDVRGLPVYLRKWYHTRGNCAGVSFAATGIMANTDPILDANRATIATAVSALNEIGNAEAWDLTSRTGRIWESQPQCHKWLEHHQLGDAWR